MSDRKVTDLVEQLVSGQLSVLSFTERLRALGYDLDGGAGISLDQFAPAPSDFGPIADELLQALRSVSVRDRLRGMRV